MTPYRVRDRRRRMRLLRRRTFVSPRPTPTGRRASIHSTHSTRSDRADGQYDHGDVLELEPALDGARGLVVELAGEEVLLLEDELPREEARPPERLGDALAEFLHLVD